MLNYFLAWLIRLVWILCAVSKDQQTNCLLLSSTGGQLTLLRVEKIFCVILIFSNAFEEWKSMRRTSKWNRDGRLAQTSWIFKHPEYVDVTWFTFRTWFTRCSSSSMDKAECIFAIQVIRTFDYYSGNWKVPYKLKSGRVYICNIFLD